MATTYRNFTVPDQSGRTAIVTGANAGLGFEISKALAAANGRVIMACRSTEKGDAARKAILDLYPDSDLQVKELDISSLASVRAFADRVSAGIDKLDLLINNAGIMATPKAQSPDGHEMQLATNHLGHFLLTGLLMPMLRDTRGSRVVAVSSLAARSGEIDFDDLMGENKYDPWKAYNQSKLANLMFGLELQRRLARAEAQTVAVIAHPGASTTNLFSTPGGGLVKRLITPFIKPLFFQSATDGAQPILFAATAPEAAPGGYYGPGKMNEMKGPPAQAKIPAAASDESTAERLWRESERLTDFAYL